MPSQVIIFWFRRDLRLEDNAGFYHALKQGKPVLPLFIFDADILDRLEDKTDRRVNFIHQQIEELNAQLKKQGSGMLVKHGSPLEIWKKLTKEYSISAVYTNNDYEPYARKRDKEVRELLKEDGIGFFKAKDQVIFERNEVVKDDGKPYTVFTPYKNKWRAKLEPFHYKPYPSEKYFKNLFLFSGNVPSLEKIGFLRSNYSFPAKKVSDELISAYKETRDIPSIDATSHLSIHLRFGTVSIRKLFAQALTISETWTNELIWREFYQQILWHFPHVAEKTFKPQFERIPWRNDENDFQKWCEGKTGYPLVDAGMRELNATGFMHNRVRMVTAGFLTKHLLIDYRWGETYFAVRLLDYDLASNNGGWQWAAGTGTDAAPYFRIFNPAEQQKKFDPDFLYIKKWVPEFGTANYPEPMVDHKFARERCLTVYKKGLGR
ncbi:MAG: DNA photolyase family protein [Bacteroidota bacterium]|nr:DNA photolyase family protein [Bacteroidota bacterium]